MVGVAYRGEAVGERGDSVSVADENVSSLELKRVIGEVSSPSEVVQDLLETTIGPGDSIFARDGPRDVRSEELVEGSGRTSPVQLVLRPAQSVEKFDGSVPVHSRHSSPSVTRTRSPMRDQGSG